MYGHNVSLKEILDAREARLGRQQLLLKTNGRPIVSFTMNIAGERKRSPLADFAFEKGLEALEQHLGRPLGGEALYLNTGCEAQFAYDMDAARLKELCMQLEQSVVGRLYDMDVLDVSGRSVTRQIPRTCLLCGNPAAVCARSRAHGLEAVQAETRRILQEFAAETLAADAVWALYREVDITPKPGLVDLANCGAHKDMDVPMFYRSAEALRSYFAQAVKLGMADSPMPELQQAGMEAERKMMDATGGVNTHRGAVYAFGLLLAAMGKRLMQGGDIFAMAASLAASALPAEGDSHGLQMRQRYGAGGARAEAMAGFPHGRMAYRKLEEQHGAPWEALLSLLAYTEDTNLLYRGGKQGLQQVQQQAAVILAGEHTGYIDGLKKLDAWCIRNNLSPGGSADLLAVGLLLYRTHKVWA